MLTHPTFDDTVEFPDLFHPLSNVILSSPMLSSIIFALALGGSNVALAATSTSYASRPTFSTIEPAVASIYATQATATPLSPVSNVKGAAFDRIVQIWLENTVHQIRFAVNYEKLINESRTTAKLLPIQICNG